MFAEYIISQVHYPLKKLYKLLTESATELHSIIALASSNCTLSYITRNELVIKLSDLLNHNHIEIYKLNRKN